jgi:hypothetical protein
MDASPRCRRRLAFLERGCGTLVSRRLRFAVASATTHPGDRAALAEAPFACQIAAGRCSRTGTAGVRAALRVSHAAPAPPSCRRAPSHPGRRLQGNLSCKGVGNVSFFLFANEAASFCLAKRSDFAYKPAFPLSQPMSAQEPLSGGHGVAGSGQPTDFSRV